MKQTLIDIQVEYDEPIPIYCDNTSPSVSQRTPWCTPRWSTFQSSIIFYRNRLHKRTLELSMWAQKNKWQTSLQNHFCGKPLNIFAKALELFLLQKWILFEFFLNAYLICLRCTWGNTIRGQFSQGSMLEWKDTFTFDDKGGDIY